MVVIRVIPCYAYDALPFVNVSRPPLDAKVALTPDGDQVQKIFKIPGSEISDKEAPVCGNITPMPHDVPC